MIPSISMWSLESEINRNKWKQKDFIQWAASHNISHVELLSYYMNKENNAEKIRLLLSEMEMNVSCYTILNDFSRPDNTGMSDFMMDLGIAVKLRAPFIRVLTGELDCSSIENKAMLVDRMKQAAKAAGNVGIKLVLENIGLAAGRSDEAVSIINEVDSEYLRINFDTANPLLADEGPAEALTRLLPFISYVHLKDFITEKSPEFQNFSQVEWRIQSSRAGLKMTGITAGKGEADLILIFKMLKENNYNGFVSVEYENDLFVEKSVIESIAFFENNIKTAP